MGGRKPPFVADRFLYTHLDFQHLMAVYDSPIRGLDDKGDTMTPCYGINAREIARPLRSGHSDGSALETWRKSDAESGANDPIGRPGTP